MSRQRAPGSVLVMVVAMLSALFIVGAAFLTTVTFEGKSIVLETSEKRQSAVVNRLSAEVQASLKRAFLGFDGKAWNQDITNSPIGNDQYGEIPGVHPLIASIEPYESNSNWFFFTASDLELALGDIPVTMGFNDGVNPAKPTTRLVQVDSALADSNGNPLFGEFDFNSSNWIETSEGRSHFNVNIGTPADSGEFELYRRDADGDGVWDSYEYRLPESRYPASIRGDLADRLRAEPDSADPPLADPNALFYALRVIPHGAMVDVGHAHRTLLEDLLGSEADGGEAVTVGGQYVPEGEELLLRRRFLLPPRDVPLSRLQTFPTASGEAYMALYSPFVSDFDAFDGGDRSVTPDWWPIDTGQDGQDISGIEDSWVQWMNPSNPRPWEDPTAPDLYDVRHLLTTISHDDQLMRLGRSAPANPDWVDEMNPNNFQIDDWPSNDPDDPLRGRLKVSLPGLVDSLLDDFYGGTVPDTATIDDLVALGAGNPQYDRLVGTIHDAFILMLRNVVDSVMDQPTKALTAASLTANLIDFIDSDLEPTQVEIRDVLTGVGTNEFVYGLEIQPYITELYHFNDGAGAYVSAIELFNPYDQPINLGAYRLIDVDTGVALQLDEDLTGTLPAGSYRVFSSNAAAGGPTGADQLGSAGGWQLEGSSQVELVRPMSGEDVIVDWFPVTSGQFDNVGGPEVSLERVTGVTSGDAADWEWSWLIPSGVQEQTGAHTMDGGGAENNATNPTGNNTHIRPVQIAFANDGAFLSGDPGGRRLAAVPTTGTLLLLSRYANSATESFTFRLSADKTKIDNGRMPVFDPLMNADSNSTPTPFTLSIPWGQLVFDYFTALPLGHTRKKWQDIQDPDEQKQARNDMIPTIDQNGLRVHGRIDINSAPWRVLAGLPIVPMDEIPAAFRDKIAAFINPTDPTLPEPIGKELAQSIVAYREARKISDNGNETADFGLTRLRVDGSGSPFTGFLTVGELANVRHPDDSTAPNRNLFDIDLGVIDDSAPELEDYVEAVAMLVALGDWVTTRSHVFTVYGTLRGAGSKSAVDQRAIRFQETVDRLPCVFNNKSPRRVGPRVVGPYTQANLD